MDAGTRRRLKRYVARRKLLERLKRYVVVLNTRQGDEATRIRLAEGIIRNVTKNPTWLAKLGLTEDDLKRFPKR